MYFSVRRSVPAPTTKSSASSHRRERGQVDQSWNIPRGTLRLGVPGLSSPILRWRARQLSSGNGIDESMSDNLLWISRCPVLTIAPSGITISAWPDPSKGGSLKCRAPNFMRPGIFLAPRIPPRISSRRAHARSPGMQRIPTSSPAMTLPPSLFTGYRHSSLIRPTLIMRDGPSRLAARSGAAVNRPDDCWIRSSVANQEHRKRLEGYLQ